MDLSDLRIFTAVVEEGGITRAARRLNRVQSNVTTRIRQLEDELGTALFLRSGKSLHLAPAGRTLLDYAERLLTLADEARAAIVDREPRGLLRLGAMESTAAVRLPPLLAALNRRHPAITVELRTGHPGELINAVHAGALEAALVAGPAPESVFESIAAFVEEPVIVTHAAHPPIAKAVPTTILVFEHGCPHRKRLEAWYEQRGALPQRVIELRSYHAMLGCVAAGMGAALLPKSVLASFAERKRLRVHGLPRADQRMTTLLVWRKNAGSPRVEALAELIDDPGARR
jgi:DNA-binding transcriptional LysR family regulator